MRFFLIALIINVCLFCQTATAGVTKVKDKDKELFDQGAELSYEGQLKMAEKLAGQERATSSSKQEDDSGTSMFLSMIWGAIGTGYFIFGKKQSRYMFLICGIGLMAFPLVVSDLLASVILGLVMLMVPFKFEL